jgi:hypothetical protein
MRKSNGKSVKKIENQIIFYSKKLNPLKQIEALDFIKWLWGGPVAKEKFSAGEIGKIETLAKEKGGKKFKNWESAKKYLQGLMR